MKNFKIVLLALLSLPAASSARTALISNQQKSVLLNEIQSDAYFQTEMKKYKGTIYCKGLSELIVGQKDFSRSSNQGPNVYSTAILDCRQGGGMDDASIVNVIVNLSTDKYTSNSTGLRVVGISVVSPNQPD